MSGGRIFVLLMFQFQYTLDTLSCFTGPENLSIAQDAGADLLSYSQVWVMQPRGSLTSSISVVAVAARIYYLPATKLHQAEHKLIQFINERKKNKTLVLRSQKQKCVILVSKVQYKSLVSFIYDVDKYIIKATAKSCQFQQCNDL